MTNVTFCKFDLPRYALCDELNEMLQYYCASVLFEVSFYSHDLGF